MYPFLADKKNSINIGIVPVLMILLIYTVLTENYVF